MKSTISAILVGSFIVAAQGAVADTLTSGAADDAGYRLPARDTYADRHAGNLAAVTAFPGAADDAGYQLVGRAGEADRFSGESVAGAVWAFPGAADDSGYHLTARSTYADTHLAHSAHEADTAE